MVSVCVTLFLWVCVCVKVKCENRTPGRVCVSQTQWNSFLPRLLKNPFHFLSDTFPFFSFFISMLKSGAAVLFTTFY